MKTKVVGGAIGIVGIALIYVILNVFVVGGQKLYHHDDQARLDSLKSELKEQKATIDNDESELTSKEDDLSSLKEEVETYESDYPDGVPEEYYDEYRQKVNDYNSQLTDYKDQYSTYQNELGSYNEKVKEANALAKKIGSTWYIVPVPGRGHE
jgi:chromosome segregation ATPase